MYIIREKRSITAKNIARLCGCKCKKHPPIRSKFIINYGVSYPYSNLNKNVIGDKLEAFQKLLAGEVQIPRFFNINDNIPDNAFPLLARKKYHREGQDIVVIKDRAELRRFNRTGYHFFTKYIRKNSEYRVHVLGNNTHINVKVNKNENKNNIVRSYENGWRQIEYKGEHKEALSDIAKRAINALGYDFGAVDVIRTKRNRFFVLEVNSAPGLEDRKVRLYAEYFLRAEANYLNNI